MALAVEDYSAALALDETNAALASVDLAEAARLFEFVARTDGEAPHASWRAARATWLLGALLPLDATEQRLAYFHRALALAGRAGMGDLIAT